MTLLIRSRCRSLKPVNEPDSEINIMIIYIYLE